MLLSDISFKSLMTRLFLPITLILFIAGCAGAPSPGSPGAGPAPEAAPDEPSAPSAGAVIFDATVAAQNMEYGAAAKMLEKLLDEQPDNIEALRLLARVYAADGDRASAASAWKRVSVLDPSDPDAAYETGTFMAREEKWEELRAKMLQTEAYGKADGRHYLLLGQADMEMGYRSEAENYLKKAGDLELAGVLLGQLYYSQGKLSKAKTAFLGVLEKNRTNYVANLHLGYISYSRGKKEAALRYYSAAHRADPADPLACLSLASLHEKAGRKKEAITFYRKALGLKKTPSAERKKVYITTLKLLMESGRTGEAVSLAKEGTSIFPSSGGILFYWGEALLAEGKNALAREKFKKAAEDPQWKKPALARFHSIR